MELDEDAPLARRPRMPGYGVHAAATGLLPWSWAVERLTAARRYWLATVGAHGGPHVAAVWAIWLDGELLFSTGSRSAKARNLARDPRCTITTERADESVVLRGTARRVSDPGVLGRAVLAYTDKYGSAFPDPDQDPVLAVRPIDVIGVIDDPVDFARTATTWVFGTRPG